MTLRTKGIAPLDPPARATAFTLIELLVVVGIISVLAAILLPVLGKTRESANRVACLSNLRQVYHAFQSYAIDNAGHAPIGYRTGSKQFNSMVYSTTAGGRWVLFGLLFEAGYIRSPGVLFCPSENNPKFIYGTVENPWPAAAIQPGQNLQAGYAARPDREIPDDPSHPPAYLAPFAMPRLSDFRGRAIFADLTAALTRLVTRHRTGLNVLYGDGSAHWVLSTTFARPAAEWPEPTFPPTPDYNRTQDAIWSALDGGRFGKSG